MVMVITKLAEPVMLFTDGAIRLQKRVEQFVGFNQELALYFSIILILGIIQTFSKIFHWQIVFGANNQYLIQIGNEIFHLCFLSASYFLYRGIQKHFFDD